MTRETQPDTDFRFLVLTRKKRPGILVWLVLLLSLYWLGGSIFLPRWAHPLLEKELSDLFGATCTIEGLTINPVTLRISAGDIVIPYPESIAQSAGRDFIRLKRLEAQIALSSLVSRALVINELRFISPEIHITRHKDSSLSPQYIFAAARGEPDTGTSGNGDRPSGGDLFPVVIRNMTLRDGTLTITDSIHNLSYLITDIDLSVPFASTLPSDEDVALAPHLSAAIGGTPVSVTGEVRPFARAQQTVFTLSTRELDLLKFRELIAPYTNLTLQRGELYTALTLRFYLDPEKAFDFSLAGSVEIANLSLADKDGTVFKTARAKVDMENVLLGPRRVLINEAVLEKPEIVIHRRNDGSLDWSDFFFLPAGAVRSEVYITAGEGAEIPKSDIASAGTTEENSGLPLQLVVGNARVTDGKLTWHDASLQSPISFSVEKVNAVFTDVSTEKGGRAEFTLAFDAGGESSFMTSGSLTMSPFHVDASVEAKKLPVAPFSGYMGEQLGLTLQNGELHTALRLRFDLKPEKAFDCSLEGRVEITNLVLAGKSDTVFKAERVMVDMENLLPGSRRAVIREAVLDKPEAVIRRLKSGSIDWNDFFSPSDTGASAPLQLNLGKARVTDGTVTWHDASLKKPVSYTMENLSAAFTDVNTAGEGSAEFTLGFDSQGAASFTASGKATLSPLRIDASVEAKELPIEPFSGYISEGLGLIAKGTASASGEISFQHTPERMRFTRGGVSFSSLQLRRANAAGTPFLDLRRIEAANVSADLTGRSVRIGRITGSGIAANLVRGKNGEILLPKPTGTQKRQPAKGRRPPTPSPWKVNVDAISISSSRFSLTDTSLATRAVLPVTDLRISGNNFATHDKKQWSVTASGKLGSSGPLNLTARGSLNPLSLTFSGKMDRADIRPLSPYLQEHSGLALFEGTFSGDCSGTIKRVPNSERGGEFAVNGNLALHGISLLYDQQELSGWGRLRVEDFAYQAPSSGGRHLSVVSVTLNSPRLSVAIDENGVSSIQKALARTETPASKQEAKGTTYSGLTGIFTTCDIGSIRITNGQANYRDARVTPPYFLRVEAITASAGNLSLDPEKESPVTASLRVNGSPVAGSGTIRSLLAAPSGQGSITVRDLDLARFTQYGERYLGYPVKSGVLTADITASLNGGILDMRNNIFIEGLELGKKVPSPDAADIPLTAAVTILRDRNGNIRFNQPISGTLGSPEFDLGGMVGKVIGSIVIKTVTSPVSFLDSLFSGVAGLFTSRGIADLTVVFPVGATTLDRTARTNLEKLGRELRRHPSAILRVTGTADRAEKDAIVDAWVEKSLRAMKYDSLPPEQKAETSPDSVRVSPRRDAQEYAELLFALYHSLPFVKESKDPAITSPQSTSAIMRILRTRTEMTDEHLLLLAEARGRVVHDFLVRENATLSQRIRLQPGVLEDSSESGGRVASFVRIRAGR